MACATVAMRYNIAAGLVCRVGSCVEAPRDGAMGCAAGWWYVGDWNEARAKDTTGDAEIVYRTARAMRLRWNWWEMGSDMMFLVVKSLRGTYWQLLGV